MNEWIMKWIPEIKKYWFWPAMILLGIVFMICQPDQKAEVEAISHTSDDQFVSETEARVAEMLRHMEGAGECVVTITLSSGEKNEYVRENGDVLVITDEKGNQSAVVSKVHYPEIAGVTIISDEAGSIAVRTRMIQAVSTLLEIGTNKICVIMRE